MNWIKLRDYMIATSIAFVIWKLVSFEQSVITMLGLILGELIYNNVTKK